MAESCESIIFYSNHSDLRAQPTLPTTLFPLGPIRVATHLFLCLCHAGLAWLYSAATSILGGKAVAMIGKKNICAISIWQHSFIGLKCAWQRSVWFWCIFQTLVSHFSIFYRLIHILYEHKGQNGQARLILQCTLNGTYDAGRQGWNSRTIFFDDNSTGAFVCLNNIHHYEKAR